MPIIDAHAHIYPGKIASRAVDAVGRFYGVSMFGGDEAPAPGGEDAPEGTHAPDGIHAAKDAPLKAEDGGTAEHLLANYASCGITHGIVHSVATTAKSVPTINTFLAEQCAAHPEFIGFGTMHQDFPDKEAEVERALALGLHGFKLHPDTQHVNMDDPRLMEFYEIIAGRVPLVVHTGDYRYGYSHPSRLVNVLKTFPDLVVDAAHMAGWSIYDIGYDVVHAGLDKLDNVYVDASSSFMMTGRRHMRELIGLWGADRVMFGSDYPMWSPAHELNEMMHCDLSDDVLENVLWRNAEAFCGVKVS